MAYWFVMSIDQIHSLIVVSLIKTWNDMFLRVVKNSPEIDSSS